MEIAIRKIKEGRGVFLSKRLLIQAGLGSEFTVEVSVANGAIVLRKPGKRVRAGWARAASALAARGRAPLLMGEFGNADDA